MFSASGKESGSGLYQNPTWQFLKFKKTSLFSLFYDMIEGYSKIRCDGNIFHHQRIIKKTK